MPVKHFVITPAASKLSKQELLEINQRSEQVLVGVDKASESLASSKITEEDNLVHLKGKIVVKVDSEYKNFHKFENGLVIRRERKFNEFNRRITQPVNCIVISSDDIPKNAEILVEHNALHETNRINDYKNSFEGEETDRVRYYSIAYFECLAWRNEGEDWKPVGTFEFALRVFKPYEGIIQGIEPKQIPDTLYVTSGELKGNVVRTLKGCDYEIVYNESFGVEGRLIVFRPNGDAERNLEEEAVAILHDVTKKVKSGEYPIGYTTKDATGGNIR